jgi:hypothetical protein
LYIGHHRSHQSPKRKLPPSKARTIDRPNEFQIRGWPGWLHFDAEVEQLEGEVLDGGELRIEDEARLRGAVHGHDIAGHGGEVGEEGAEAVDRQAVVGAAVAGELLAHVPFDVIGHHA